jgi:hypothetical protein
MAPWLAAGIEPAQGLVIRALDGPSRVHRGADMILHCKYDLEGCPLYAVKWFRGRREIFRFEPERWPHAAKIFPLDKIRVDVSRSLRFIGRWRLVAGRPGLSPITHRSRPGPIH